MTGRPSGERGPAEPAQRAPRDRREWCRRCGSLDDPRTAYNLTPLDE